jgi:antitoxin (DNA-binding transcriptional repressor) of toxin-antitoxin stability system
MTAPVQVEITELRQNLPAWLERVRIGEEISIVEHGAVVARLIPPVNRRTQARVALEALRARARVGDVESPVKEVWDAANGHRA